MSVDSLLDSAFITLLGKARQDFETERAAPRTATMCFEWGGGGSALSASTTDPILLEVPFASDIVWAQLFAGSSVGAPVLVTTVLDLQLTQWATFGGSSPVYGSGLSPRITADSLAQMDLTGWLTHLAVGDVLLARMLSFTGAATWVALVLLIRSSEVLLGAGDVTDAAGAAVTDSDGNPLIFRN